MQQDVHWNQLVELQLEIRRPQVPTQSEDPELYHEEIALTIQGVLQGGYLFKGFEFCGVIL